MGMDGIEQDRRAIEAHAPAEDGDDKGRAHDSPAEEESFRRPRIGAGGCDHVVHEC